MFKSKIEHWARRVKYILGGRIFLLQLSLVVNVVTGGNCTSSCVDISGKVNLIIQDLPGPFEDCPGMTRATAGGVAALVGAGPTMC